MREMGRVNTGESNIALDLELMGGDYNFVLLVNCESGLEKSGMDIQFLIRSN